MSASKRTTDPLGEIHFTDRSQTCVMCPIRGKDIEELGEGLDEFQKIRDKNLERINECLDGKLGWSNFWQIFSVTVLIASLILGALFYRQNENFNEHDHLMTLEQSEKNEKYQKERTDDILRAIEELKTDIRALRK